MANGSIANIIKEIQKDELSADCIRFFRGQESIHWSLLPSLFREKQFKDNEYNIYHDIISKCSDEFKHCSSDFDKMVKMQHYGIPTRLLDITTNLIVALYFACQDCNPKENAVIYRFDVCKADILYFDSKKVQEQISITNTNKLDNDLAIYCIIPELSNPRIIRQSGAFFWFNDSAADLTKVYPYKSYEISKSHKKNMREQLNNMGINMSQYFPELDKVAEEIRTKYKLMK